MTMVMERARPGLSRACRTPGRWAAVGRSAHADSAVAGREAVGAALDGHGDAGIVLLFASCAYDLAALTAAAAEVAGDVPVAGSASAGEIDAGGRSTHSVVAIAMGGEGLSFSVASVEGSTPRDAGARAAACLGDVGHRPHRVLILFTDIEAADHGDVVRGAYSVSGAGVPLVGGVAGHPAHDELDARCVLHGTELLRQAVVAVAIGSDAPLGIGVRHGWSPDGAPMLVT